MIASGALFLAALLICGRADRFSIEWILTVQATLEISCRLLVGRLSVWKLPRFAWFLVDFAWDIIRCNVEMAFDALTPRDWHQVRMVKVPVGDMTDAEVALLNHRINLSPGTLVCRIDPERQHLYVHDMYGKGASDRAAQLRHPIDMLRGGVPKRFRDPLQPPAAAPRASKPSGGRGKSGNKKGQAKKSGGNNQQ